MRPRDIPQSADLSDPNDASGVIPLDPTEGDTKKLPISVLLKSGDKILTLKSDTGKTVKVKLVEFAPDKFSFEFEKA